MTTRYDGRTPADVRPIDITINTNAYAEGSCIIKTGKTQVYVTATVEDSVPNFMRGTGKGWLTAEYNMLPRSTTSRIDRKRHMDDGRKKEIQRLIGRSLRAAIDFTLLGERQIKIDCDILQADGGTRTAAINGGMVALSLAINNMLSIGMLEQNPITGVIGAISCGVVNNIALADLCYEEDSTADTDANFVMQRLQNGEVAWVEITASAEKNIFTTQQLQTMQDLASDAIHHILEYHDTAITHSNP